MPDTPKGPGLAHHPDDPAHLSGSHLNGDPSPGTEQTKGSTDQATMELETVSAAVQRQPGFVIPDLGLQPWNLPGRNVGRVGDNRVEGRDRTEGLQDVSGDKPDAGRAAAAPGVPEGDPEGLP